MAKGKSKTTSLSNALGSSLKAEETSQTARAQALEDKFAVADVIVGKAASSSNALPPPAVSEKAPPQDPPVIRDSFTMPEAEYGVFDRLGKRAMALVIKNAKTSFIRAGLHLLEQMDDKEFAEAVRAFPPLKPGRRAKRT